MANLPASCPTGTTANVNGRMLDAGAHVFHVEHPCFTTGAANHTQQIQKAIDATIVDPAVPSVGAGTVVFEPGKVYMVDSISLPAGITLELNGAVIKRIPPPAGEDPGNVTKWRRTFTTQGRLWSSSQDSPLLTIRGGTIDGNRAAQGAYTSYQLEQAHLIFLMADPANAGRLRVKIEDLVLRDGVADAVEVFVNTDLQMTDVRTVDCFRGGLVVTGGHTRVQVANLRTGGTTHTAGIDIEVDGGGYGNSYAVDIQMVNVECEADFGIAVSPGSTILGTNVHVRKPSWTINGGGEPPAGQRASRIQFTNSFFALGVNDSYVNRVVYPGDMAFLGCTFHVTEAGLAEANREMGLTIYWNTSGTGYKHQRVRLVDCVWSTSADVEAGDTVRAVHSMPDVLTNGNRLVVINPEIPSSFDTGVYLAQGGNVEIRGGKIKAATPIHFANTAGGFDVDLTVHGLDVAGAGKYMHLVTSSPATTVRTSGVTVAEADCGISTDYGVGGTRYIGGRTIIVESSPVGRLGALTGDVARLRVPVPGQTFEWVCTTGTPDAPWVVWKALSTLAA